MHRRRTMELRGALSLAVLSFALQSQAYAQTSPEQPSAGIDTVIVTAQKRAEDVQKVPISVTALSSEGLEDAKIENAVDLQFNVPNVLLAANRNITIRGVGSATFGGSNDANIGVLSNGVFIQNPSATTEYYDLERVEVARGPQGTLLGRNTTGGTINYISRKPGDTFGGYVDVQLESFDGVRVVGALDLPISDQVKQRFAYNVIKRDGYTRNLFTNGRIDGRDQWAARSSTHVDLDPATKIDLVVDYSAEDSNRGFAVKSLCTPDPTFGCSPDSVSAAFPTTNFPIDRSLLPGVVRPNMFSPNPSDLRTVNIDYDPRYRTDETMATLEISHDFGNLTLTSVSGYRWTTLDSSRDFDQGTAPNAFIPGTYSTPLGTLVVPDVGGGRGAITYLVAGKPVTSTDYNTTQVVKTRADQYSSELRLASDFDGPLNFLVGGYYLFAGNQGSVRTYIPAGRTFGSIAIGDTPRATVDSSALFGEVYYELTPDLKLTGGLRYTQDKKEIRTGSGTFAVTYREAAADFDETTGRAAILWNPKLSFTNDTNLFASYSRGFKSGGFNPGVTGANSTFNSEFVDAIEVGAKNRLLDNLLQLNMSLFHYDYNDLTVGNIVGTLATNVNIPSSEVQGFELEAIAEPTPNLTLEGSLGLLKTEIKSDFLSSDPTRGGAFFQLQGNELPNSPSNTLKLAVQYAFDPIGEWTFRPRIDYYTQSGFFSREFNTGADKVGRWEQLDLQLLIGRMSSDWTATIFVKNALGEDSITFQEANSNLVGSFRSVFLLDPRTVGISLHVPFK